MRKRAPPMRSLEAGSMMAPSFSASAAGAGVVIASRPKNGAGKPFIRLLVDQQQDRLAAAQQREDAPRALRAFGDLLAGAVRHALAHHPAVDIGIVHGPIDLAAFVAIAAARRSASSSQLAKWPETNMMPLPLAIGAFEYVDTDDLDARVGPGRRHLVEMGVFGDVRPRLSHISTMIASHFASLISGYAARRLDRARPL